MIEPKAHSRRCGCFFVCRCLQQNALQRRPRTRSERGTLKTVNKKAPHPQMRAGERGDAALKKYKGGTQKNAVLP